MMYYIMKKKTRNKRLRLIVLFFFSFIILGWCINLIFYKPFNINIFFERLFISYAWKDPELLSKLGILDKYGIKIHYNKLTDLSNKHIHEDLKYTTKELEILESYNLKKSNSNQQFSAKILKTFLEERIYSDEFIKHEYTINHLTSPQIDILLFFTNIHQIKTIKDAQSYLQRLHLLKNKIQQIIEIIELGQDYYNIPPQLILERVQTQLFSFISNDLKDNILYKDFVSKLNDIPNLDVQSGKRLIYDLKLTLSNVVIPAYELLFEKINNLLVQAPSNLGMWSYDSSNFYYAYILKKYTTQDILPESIFELCDTSLSKYLKEIEKLSNDFISEGLVEGSDTLGRLLNKIIYNSKLLYKDDKIFIKDFENRILKTAHQLNLLFDDYQFTLPLLEPCLYLLDNDLTDFSYYAGSLYNKRKAKLYYSPLELPKSKLLTPFNVYQWIIPGLHTQKSIQSQQSHLPIFRRHIEFTYYKLGWQMYSLDLAQQLHLYEKTLLNKIVYLHELYLNYALAFVDLGLHYYRWDYHTCLNLLLIYTGLPKPLAELEILKIASTPGQSASLVVGYNYLKKTENKVRLKQGEGFDLNIYLKKILELGPINSEVFYELEAYFD